MGVVVTLDPVAFATEFPEFAYLSGPQITEFFAIATTFHRNDGGGPIATAQVQTEALYCVTAHFAKLYAPTPSGQNAPDNVGRVSDASEGSVSASFDYPAGTPTMAFWVQTKYGARYWALTAPYRTMRYIRSPRHRRPFGLDPNDPRFFT